MQFAGNVCAVGASKATPHLPRSLDAHVDGVQQVLRHGGDAPNRENGVLEPKQHEDRGHLLHAKVGAAPQEHQVCGEKRGKQSHQAQVLPLGHLVGLLDMLHPALSKPVEDLSRGTKRVERRGQSKQKT